jgi:hypothetical protein
VLVATCGCGWGGCGGRSKMGQNFFFFFVIFSMEVVKRWHCGSESGSGLLIVVALERGDRRGSNGVCLSVWLWLGWQWQSFENNCFFLLQFCRLTHWF